MATLTRDAVVLSPVDVLGWSLERAGTSTVHPIIGDAEPDVTVREPRLRAGVLRTLWQTDDAASAAMDALSVPGGAWTLDVATRPALAGAFLIVGAVTLTALTDAGAAWAVDLTVQEVTA